MGDGRIRGILQGTSHVRPCQRSTRFFVGDDVYITDVELGLLDLLRLLIRAWLSEPLVQDVQCRFVGALETIAKATEVPLKMCDAHLHVEASIYEVADFEAIQRSQGVEYGYLRAGDRPFSKSTQIGSAFRMYRQTHGCVGY